MVISINKTIMHLVSNIVTVIHPIVCQYQMTIVFVTKLFNWKLPQCKYVTGDPSEELLAPTKMAKICIWKIITN